MGQRYRGKEKPDSHISDKNSPKKWFCKGVQLYFEISLLSFIHKIFIYNSELSADMDL